MASIAYISEAFSADGLIDYTFPSVPLGSGGGERTFFIWAYSRGATASPGATLSVNGVLVNPIASHAIASGPCNYIYLFRISASVLPVQTASSGAIVVGWGTTRQRCGVVVMGTSDALATALFHQAKAGEALSANPANFTYNLPLNTPAGGVAIALAFSTDTGTLDNSRNAWTNAAEVLDKGYSAIAPVSISAAMVSDTLAATALPISCVYSYVLGVYHPIALAISLAPVAETVPTPWGWWEASDGATRFQEHDAATTAAAANNDPVGRWLSKVGSKHFSALATDTTRPAYKTSAGVHWVEADGVNDALAWLPGGDPGLYSSASGFSIFLKARFGSGAVHLLDQSSQTDNDPVYWIGRAFGTDTGLQVFVRNEAGTVQVGGGGWVEVHASAFDGADHVYGIVDNLTSVTGYVDGGGASPVGYTRSGVMSVTNVSLGAAVRAAVAAYSAARYYEIVIFDSVLSAAEAAEVSTYLTFGGTPPWGAAPPSSALLVAVLQHATFRGGCL